MYDVPYYSPIMYSCVPYSAFDYQTISVHLENQDLWTKFHQHTNEMIITKLGRRMFPSLKISLEGLDRGLYYCILMEVAPSSRRRYKYVGCEPTSGVSDGEPKITGWTTTGGAEPEPPIHQRIYIHPDSPATGSHWMKQPINFNKLKLTNNVVDHHHNVVLCSMHKYIPKIWVILSSPKENMLNLFSKPSLIFNIPEAEFIAVTAYQNESITKLKIDYNPFAKGFRETGKSCKRKLEIFKGLQQEENSCDDQSFRSSSSGDSGDSSSEGGSPPPMIQEEVHPRNSGDSSNKGASPLPMIQEELHPIDNGGSSNKGGNPSPMIQEEYLRDSRGSSNNGGSLPPMIQEELHPRDSGGSSFRPMIQEELYLRDSGGSSFRPMIQEELHPRDSGGSSNKGSNPSPMIQEELYLRNNGGSLPPMIQEELHPRDSGGSSNNGGSLPPMIQELHPRDNGGSSNKRSSPPPRIQVELHPKFYRPWLDSS